MVSAHHQLNSAVGIMSYETVASKLRKEKDIIIINGDDDDDDDDVDDDDDNDIGKDESKVDHNPLVPTPFLMVISDKLLIFCKVSFCLKWLCV